MKLQILITLFINPYTKHNIKKIYFVIVIIFFLSKVVLNVDRLRWSDPIANEEDNGARMFRLLMTSFKKKKGFGWFALGVVITLLSSVLSFM